MGKTIPRVDEGIKGQKGFAYEETQRFYAQNQIPEYIHSAKGGKCIKFEFADLLDAYRDDDDDGNNVIVNRLSYVEVGKKSFLNNINGVARYINYFIHYFDDDDELLMAYFFMMFSIMNTEIELPPEDFIENLFAYFGSPSMTDKIANMVDYNTEESLLSRSDRTVYDQSIQLTDDHLKAIMGLSCIHKFIIPIVSQYYNVKKDLLKDHNLTDKELYFYAFTRFIPCFDDRYDILLYDKLYHTATTRISKTEGHDQLMWGRRARTGVSPVSFAGVLMRDLFIDISQKVIFNRSAIAFIHVCFDKAIRNELIQQDKYEYAEMETVASDSVNETMSKWDQWQTANSTDNQRDRFRTIAAVSNMIERRASRLGLDFSTKKVKKEFNFYRDNITRLEDAQLNLIHLYFAADMMDGSMLIRSASRSDINKLIMIMKREMEESNYVYIPQFISGKMDLSNAKRYNKKKIEKAFIQHPCYDDWIEQFGDAEGLVNPDRIYTNVKTLISCPMVIVDYHKTELNGKRLAIDETSAVDEMVRFYCNI